MWGWNTSRWAARAARSPAARRSASAWPARSAAGYRAFFMYWTNPPSACTSATTSGLIATLKHLRGLGNTVIVVDHDEETVRAADHVVDMGPGAGIHGGRVVAEGTPDEIARSKDSLTGQYLSGKKFVPVPGQRRISSSPRRGEESSLRT